MEWGFNTIESWIFLVVETAILIAVIWEGVISHKAYRISKLQFNLHANKYKRFKNKTLEDKIKEL